MGWLISIASIFGIEVESLRQRLQKEAVAWGLVGVFALIGVVFILVALDAGLATWIGPVWAPLAIAAVFLIVAVVVYAVRDAARRRERVIEAERKRQADAAALLSSAAVGTLPRLLRSPLLSRVAVPASGAVVAAVLYSGVRTLLDRRKRY